MVVGGGRGGAFTTQAESGLKTLFSGSGMSGNTKQDNVTQKLAQSGSASYSQVLFCGALLHDGSGDVGPVAASQ